MVLLAIEGATLLDIGAFLTVHAFVGMLLVPVAALKLASTGWRMLRYYLNGEEYVRRGPPHVALRAVVAPLIVASTLLLFVSGVLLISLDEPGAGILALHKASFIVWLGATSVHVLAHVPKLPRVLRLRVPGAALWVAVVGSALVAGVLLALSTVRAAHRLEDSATGYVGIDVR